MLANIIAIGLTASDDVNRYVMEGQQVLHGINPYATAPTESADLVPQDIMTGMNHPTMTAIYPPVALAAQAGIQHVMPNIIGFEIIMPILSLLLIFLSLGLIIRYEMNPGLILLVAWNPALIIFGSGEAHNDILLALAVVLALLAWSAGKEIRTVTALAIGALCKPFAVIPLAVVGLQTPWRKWWPAFLLPIVAYLPFLNAGSGITSSLFTFSGTFHFHGALYPWLRLALEPLFGHGQTLENVIRVVLVVFLHRWTDLALAPTRWCPIANVDGSGPRRALSVPANTASHGT